MPRTVRVALTVLLAFCCLGRTARAQDASPAPRAPQPEHYFILLFDYPAGGLRQIEDMSTAVEGWVDARLQPGDAVAVASYYGCELLVQQDFTRDRAAVASAIADAVRGRSHAGVVDAGAPALADRLPSAEELARRTASFYGLLQVLAEAAQGVPGRKNLLLFSKGFGRSHLVETETPTAGAEGPESGLAGLSGSPIQEKYLVDRHLFEPTLEALAAAQISLYPVDLATDYRETYPLAGVMCQLAAGTRGRYFYPVSDIPALLDRVVEDEIAEGPAEPADRLAGSVPAPARLEEPAKGRE